MRERVGVARIAEFFPRRPRRTADIKGIEHHIAAARPIELPQQLPFRIDLHCGLSALGNLPEQRTQERRLAGARCTGDEQMAICQHAGEPDTGHLQPVVFVWSSPPPTPRPGTSSKGVLYLLRRQEMNTTH